MPDFVAKAIAARREMRKLFTENRFREVAGNRALVHAIPVGYKIDGANGIRDPRGLSGSPVWNTRFRGVT